MLPSYFTFMKVICVNRGHVSPIAKIDDGVKEGKIYTVRCEQTGFSSYAQRVVEAYGFEEIDGLYEKEMFMPLSEFDERLIHCLKTKPFRKNKNHVSSIN